MTDAILQTLSEIEQKNNVRILFAVESGSRAWGFASADSDYDVRYIYIRSQKDYLRLNQPRDTIEGPLDDVMDFSGWDLRKALLLLQKTNPSLMEWVHSPIVYRTTPVWQTLAADFPRFFHVQKNMYHYLSMASTDWDKMLKADQVKLKRYLYTLRTLLCCRWLEKFGSAPPIEFSILCDTVLPEKLKPSVEELLRRKKCADEIGLTTHFPDVDDFVSEELPRLRAYADALPKEAPQDFESLNKMFFTALAQAWDIK